MSKMLCLAILGGAMLGTTGPAMAGMPVTETMECSIGGKKFEFTTTASYTIFGTRPDGKPHGSWHFPLDIPECPDNGLVMFDEFSSEELTRLPSILEKADYQALRGSETSYYRASFLAKALGRDHKQQLGLLRQAIWQTDDNKDQRRKYFELYLAQSIAFPQTSFGLDDGWWELSFVNAERELGRFADAQTRLNRLNIDNLRSDAAEDDVDFSEGKASLVHYITKMRDAVERAESGAEPLDLLDANQAAQHCRDGDQALLSEFDRKFCQSEAIVAVLKSWS